MMFQLFPLELYDQISPSVASAYKVMVFQKVTPFFMLPNKIWLIHVRKGDSEGGAGWFDEGVRDI